MRAVENVRVSFTPVRSELSRIVRGPLFEAMIKGLSKFCKHHPAWLRQEDAEYLCAFVLAQEQLQQQRVGGGLQEEEQGEEEIEDFDDDTVSLGEMCRILRAFLVWVSRSSKREQWRLSF